MKMSTQKITWLSAVWANPVALGTAVILLAMTGFVVWASWAPLSGAVVAFGLVKAETNRKSVQHGEGGVIRAIHVRDGASVQAGQALLELEDVSVDSNHQLLVELVVFERIKRDRLDAEQQLSPNFRLKSEDYGSYDRALVDTAFQREHKIFQVRRQGLDQQVSTLTQQLGVVAQEERALRAQIEADKRAIELLREELGINQSLYQEKFVAKARILGFERILADYQAKLGEHEAALAQAGQRRQDIQLRIAAVRNEYQRVAAEEYKEASARLVEYRERLRQVEDAVRRKTVTAPASGRVVNLRVHAPGEVAGPRDVLMEIVPDQENLVLEVRVPVDGIKDLYIGQSADIRFTAYKQRTTPIVTGKVTYVSADALADKNGVPYYQAHILPDAESLRQAGITGLQPGMAAEVFIRTEGRTALDYLLAPIMDSMRRSLREK